MMVTRELGDPFRRDALALPVRHLARYRSTATECAAVGIGASTPRRVRSSSPKSSPGASSLRPARFSGR